MIALCLGYFHSGATHIVGGDFYYNQLSSTRYEIVMELYLDCFNGNPDAIAQDKFAIIGIFNAKSNAFIDTILVERSSPKRVKVANYVCALPPSSECIDQYTYKRTITLVPNDEGYILSFQRCCRNNSISNLIFPGGTGATYWLKIPPRKDVSWNNMARFKKLPPNYLCTNEELIWDHSAVDPDGDSLVYELYQPYKGASQTFPRPDFPANPPYEGITWQAGYTTNNQMHGNPILTINRKSGELHVVPNKTGQFVVGVKVKEYRNGLLINETLRDYQMNVYNCQPIITAAFFKRDLECSDTVNFINQSKKATHFEWYFGDPNDPEAMSFETNPTHIYPGNGKYKVKLIALDDRNCSDTTEDFIEVLSEINVDIGPDTNVCDNFEVYLEADYPTATSIRWSNGKFGKRVLAKDTGIYTVKVYYFTCFGTDTLFIHSSQVKLDLPEDSLYCEAVNGELDAGVENVHYKWSTSPADTFRHLTVDKPGTYSLQIRNDIGCTDRDSIRLFIATKPEIGPYYFVCNEFTYTIDAGEIPESRYRWDNGSTGRFRTITDQGKYWVTVWQRHCNSSDTLEVINPVIPLDLGNDTIYCDSFNVTLVAPDDMATYSWNTEATSQTINVTSPGKYSVLVYDTNGCSRYDSITLLITPSPEIDLGIDTAICVRDEITIGIDEQFVSYQWNTGDDKNKIRVAREGLYVLQVVDKYKCTGIDSVFIREDPNALANDLYVPNAFTPNGDGLNDLFPFSEQISQREYHLQIYNRWGQKVFDSALNDIQSWNATFKEEKVCQDAYVYLMRYRGCDGDIRNLSGTVTVLR